VKGADALALVPVFGRDELRQISVAASHIAGSIREHLVREELRPNYVRFLRRVFEERARQLGWQPKPGEDDDTRLLRAAIVPFVASNGEDAELTAEARRLAERWLEDRKAVDPNLVSGVLQTAAATGDHALFDRYLAAVKATTDRRQREHLLSALGSFHDPSIAKAGMELVLTGQFDFREAETLLFRPIVYPATQALPFEFVKANYDELLKKIPRAGAFDAAASLPFTGMAFCDERSRAEVEGFFASRVSTVTGGSRNLEQTVESIRLCEALVQSQQANVAEFLRSY
jgi:alanyl aminopeptidase